jgi:hypothetical protein
MILSALALLGTMVAFAVWRAVVSTRQSVSLEVVDGGYDHAKDLLSFRVLWTDGLEVKKKVPVIFFTNAYAPRASKW